MRLLKGFLLAVLVGSAVDLSFAGLGKHDFPLFVEGSCAICHNNAASASTRGWGIDNAGQIPARNWLSQPLTILCWSCHRANNSFGASAQEDRAISDYAHGFNPANAPPGVVDPTRADNAAMFGSGLAYASSTSVGLQCTTCHNVHSDTNRPFIARPTIQELCLTCHPNRNTSTVGDNNVGVGSDNVSLHPVNVPPIDIAGNGPTNLKNPIDNAFRTPRPADAGEVWTLGGKLTGGTTGNLSCETCHVVHLSYDGQVTENILAIYNGESETDWDSNPFCEGCHYGGKAGQFVASATDADHPLDNNAGNPSIYPSPVSLPSDWTQGRLDGISAFTATAGGRPRCGSCHDSHGGLGGTSLERSPVPTTAGGEWCFSCHGTTVLVPAAHHSANGNEGGQFLSSVQCKDCHGLGWTGHNGFFQRYVQDTGFTTPAYGRTVGTADLAENKDSALCLYCHRDGNPLRWRPVLGHADNEAISSMPPPHGTRRGEDSHYLGPPVVANWGVILKGDSWQVDNEAYSKYRFATGGGAVPVDNNTSGAEVICESCHNVTANEAVNRPGDYPDRVTSGWASNLLLLAYQDDSSGVGQAGSSVDSGLCLGCHPSGAVVNHNHPLNPVDISRADQPGAPGVLSFPAADTMDCDSCHRPHSASDNSAVPSGSTLSDGTILSRTGHFLLEVDGKGSDGTSHQWHVLCLECHSK